MIRYQHPPDLLDKTPCEKPVQKASFLPPYWQTPRSNPCQRPHPPTPSLTPTHCPTTTSSHFLRRKSTPTHYGSQNILLVQKCTFASRRNSFHSKHLSIPPDNSCSPNLRVPTNNTRQEAVSPYTKRPYRFTPKSFLGRFPLGRITSPD